MAAIIQSIWSGYRTMVESGDPRVAHLPLMRSPLLIATIGIAYLLFALKIGPNLMKNREPYNLNKIIIGYNLTQIILNCYGLYYLSFYFSKVSIFCTPIDEPDITAAHYGYFLLKTIDLIETIFFALRKKFQQISVLHLYHHAGMFWGTWATCNYFPGGQLFFLGFINLFVHAVMYVYYLLSAWDSRYQKNIWWKKHLTELQIVQHCLVVMSLALPLFQENCNYPKAFLKGVIPAILLLIHLFVSFYRKAYLQKKPKDKE